MNPDMISSVLIVIFIRFGGCYDSDLYILVEVAISMVKFSDFICFIACFNSKIYLSRWLWPVSAVL